MRKSRIAGVIAGAAALAAGAAVFFGGPLQHNPLVVRLFGPPRLEMKEAYAGTGGSATFDHSAFDQLLDDHVEGFEVDYPALQQNRAKLDAYLASLETAPFDGLDRDGKLALLINAYNAFTLALILDHSPLASIKDIPSAERWDAVRWNLGGRTLSLTQIEHEELRAKFIEPRLHFAINCASVGCPPLRNEAYDPARLDAQLREQSEIIHADTRWIRIDGDTVHLTPLYLWYGTDFAQVAGSELAFAAQFRPELANGTHTIQWMDYDWRLNAR